MQANLKYIASLVHTDSNEAGNMLILASLASGVIAAGASKAINTSSNALAGVAAALNRTADNLTSGMQSILQSTDADDETTYPGLEQLILPQQELR